MRPFASRLNLYCALYDRVQNIRRGEEQRRGENMTDNQRSRFEFARNQFPDKREREFLIVSFNNETSPCSMEHAHDLAEARRTANAICAGGAQAEIYHFDGTNLWLLGA